MPNFKMVGFIGPGLNHLAATLEEEKKKKIVMKMP